MKHSILISILAFVVYAAGLQAAEPVKPVVAPSPEGSTLLVTGTEKTIKFTEGTRPLAEYRFGEVNYKPYIEKLCTPSGRNILRDSPHDHLHHHSLMMAFSIDGCDFWAEWGKDKNGVQQTDSVSARVDKRVGRIKSTITWIKTDKKPIATEQRDITVSSSDGAAATLLNWRSTLSTAPGVEKTTISGSHYFGLGMRFVQSMDKDGKFFFSKAKASTAVRGDDRVTECQWAAYTAKLDSKPVTVALFAHPDNPRPLYAFTMGDKSGHFAYLAGTINVYRKPLELLAEKPVTLCWGVAVFDGNADAKAIDAARKKWLKMTSLNEMKQKP